MMKWHPYPVGVSYGELILWFTFVALLVFWICYWSVDFTYDKTQAVILSEVHVNTEATARLFGHLSNLFCGLLLLPASRTGLMVEIFAVPYERTLKYHRMLGIVTYFSVTIHAFIWWTKWAGENTLLHNVVNYNDLKVSPYYDSYDDYTTTLAELAWLLVTITIGMAFFIRRRNYEWFQYSHKFIGIIFYVTAILHGWSFW